LGVKKILEGISKADNTQRAILVIAIFSIIFTAILTWDVVIYRGVGIEIASRVAGLISEYGAFGLLINSLKLFGYFIPLWVGWVLVSQNKRKIAQPRRFLALCFLLTWSLTFFTLNFLVLIHNLLFFGFRSTVLLPFLVPLCIAISLFLVLFSLLRMRQNF